MKTVRLVDALLVLRRKLELDTSGYSLRNFYYELLAQCDEEVVFFCFEGKDSLKPRRALYPDYKMNRVPAAESIYEYVRLFRDTLLPNTPAISVSVPEREGDDVIASLAEHFATTRKVIVETGDADLRQLETIPNVSVSCNSLSYIPPEHIRLYKAMVGDSSDNIHGIPGFGEKSFFAIDTSAWAIWFADGCNEIPPADVKPKVRDWIIANREDCRTLWKIVGFLPIPEKDIVSHSVVGTPDREAVEELLRAYCQ